MEKECRQLYRQAFCDPNNDFENLLFKHCFKYINTLNTENGIVSMCFLLPCEILADKKYDGVYLYAAATRTEFRARGYMSTLIEKAKAENDIIILRPANSKLVKYYNKLGFKPIKAVSKDSDKNCIIPKKSFGKLSDALSVKATGEEYTLMYYSKKDIIFENLNFKYSMN